MELRYPFVILIVIFIIVCYLMVAKKRDNKYKSGSKIANTEYLKKSSYYKKKLKEYNFIKKVLISIIFVAIACSTLLIARLTSVTTSDLNKYNRDIFLCLDISQSVDELNKELVENLKDTVNELKGERFGISIFNTSSVVLVPLTDDYDYVIDVLNQLKKSLDTSNSIDYNSDLNDYLYNRQYIISGTLEDAETRGSSLIGDGLASCVYSFSNTNLDRTRIVIFSTDNELQGKPLVTLSEAASISKSKGVIVFGIGTKIMNDTDRANFKKAVEHTGGKYYDHSSSTVNNIVKDIESTSKSLLENQNETKKTDIPLIPFILLLISISIIIIISKKVIK